MLSVLAASPSQPLPEWQRVYQLTRMLLALDALERAPAATVADWTALSDAVNMLETLVGMGLCCDEHGLIADAHTAMGEAGERHRRGKPLRLDGPGIQVMRAVMEDYSMVINALSERAMITAHRLCEKRIVELLGKEPKKKKGK